LNANTLKAKNTLRNIFNLIFRKLFFCQH